MNPRITANSRPILLTTLFFVFVLSACDKTLVTDHGDDKTKLYELPDIGIEELLRNAEMIATVTPRSHGCIARARGRGTIPSGEYAGMNFQITLQGNYSGIGDSTLIGGSALIRIRGEFFQSVMDPLLHSFCCSEGGLEIVGSDHVFWRYGQVNHFTADETA